VQDVNVFLYDVRGIARPQHFYVRGDVLECSVPVGEYEVYAVANLHEDMGAMDREELLAYEFRVPRSYASLPMSGQAVCTVGPKTQSVTVSVRRNVAKIVCNISLDGTFYDLKLQSVQMMDMAGSTMLFSENQQARELCSSELSTMASYEVRKASRTYYLAENCRGEVPGIVNQQQKCADNAPEGATFLRIKAQRGSRQVIYDVYLGENNTTNFDVRRNTVQTLDIRIKGNNEVDARIHSFEVKISDDLPDAEFGRTSDRCIYATGKRLSIAVMDREKAGDLSAKIRLVAGASGALQVGGHSVASDITVPLGGSSDVYEIPIAYDPGTVYTTENSRLIYEVTVSNTDGYSYTKTFTRDFYNMLTVYTYWSGRDNTAGRLEDVTAVGEIKTWTGPAFYTRLLSLEDGPTMPVVANDGFAFKGWYADSGLTRKVSDANPYQHPMTSYYDTLYTEFVKEWVYIYTKLDEVLLVSDTGFRIDRAKQAFIVAPGSRCSISGKIGLLVTTWWDNPESSLVRRVVSTKNPYDFTATANRTLIPGYDAVSKDEMKNNRTTTSTD